MQNPRLRYPTYSLPKIFALLAAFVCVACLAIPLAAQDGTVMPPELFDLPDNPDQPDTPPTLLTKWLPVFPEKLRAMTEPNYVIVTQQLDQKGKRGVTHLFSNFGFPEPSYAHKSVNDSLPNLQCAPAKKNGKAVESDSWIGVIFNPASASENNANATPRILKVAPILFTRKQWGDLGFKDPGSSTIRGSIEIALDGAVKNFEIKADIPSAQAIRPYIERSLAQWQFAPARKDGQAVDATLTLGIVLEVFPPTTKPDKPPVLVKRVTPKYPQSMKNSRAVGEVTLDFVVEADGQVSSPWVVMSTYREFEQPAIDAVSQWRFKPGTKNGKSVATKMRMSIVFNP